MHPAKPGVFYQKGGTFPQSAVVHGTVDYRTSLFIY